MVTIEVPDELYEDFCTLLDAGIQFFEEMSNGDLDYKQDSSPRTRWSEEEKKCAEFVEQRMWEKK